MQQQYATISVVNHGSSGCWLVGYAQVSLLVGGHALGHPAVPVRPGAPAAFVRSGRTVTASLHGPSTCNAKLSDRALIAAPGQSKLTDTPLPMRGCSLFIEAFKTV
jgi:hypothetical protein